MLCTAWESWLDRFLHPSQWGMYCGSTSFGTADASPPLASMICSISLPHPDFMDTVGKMTQWHRPVWRNNSISGSGVQAVDTPMRHTQRASRTTVSQVSAPPAVIPSTTTAVTGQAVDEPLPPGWETRTTSDGKTCERPNYSYC